MLSRGGREINEIGQDGPGAGREVRASREFELLTLLAAIVGSANESIVSSTVDGVITSWNAAAERMYGFTAAEIIGRSASLVIPPETAAELMPVLQRVRQGEEIEQFETRLRRKDGSIIEVSLTDFPIRDANGVVVGTSSITRDMTERNRANARFRRADRAGERPGRAAVRVPARRTGRAAG
jgi:PAS domain S-box-containing protein